MATRTVELDQELVARAEEVAGGDLKGYIEAAIRRQLEDEAFSRILDELDAEAGPLPEELVAEAERFWHGS
jgi:hypothetical protein